MPSPAFLLEQPEEVWFFLRIAAYALFIGAVYWFVSHEPAGTMLLLGFGIAAGFGTLILALGARRARQGSDGPVESRTPDMRPDGPFGDESGRIPGSTFHPLILALGVALAALGLVFGPWLIIPGAALALVGALGWGGAASREYRATDPPSPQVRREP